MQYTIRDIPADVDRELRRRARQASTSVNALANQALREFVGLSGGSAGVKKRDLSDLIGKHHFNKDFDEAMKHFSKVNPETWK